MANCSICKRELDVPGDPESDDCGGDCTKCMAEAGDEDCQRALGWSEQEIEYGVRGYTYDRT